MKPPLISFADSFKDLDKRINGKYEHADRHTQLNNPFWNRNIPREDGLALIQLLDEKDAGPREQGTVD